MGNLTALDNRLPWYGTAQKHAYMTLRTAVQPQGLKSRVLTPNLQTTDSRSGCV